jgi:hypothetical protein
MSRLQKQMSRSVRKNDMNLFKKDPRGKLIGERLYNAYLGFNENDRELLLLYYEDLRTAKEIADELGETTDIIEARLNRLLQEFEKRANIPTAWHDGEEFDDLVTKYWPSPFEEDEEESLEELCERQEQRMKHMVQFRSLYANGQNDPFGLRALQLLAAIDVLGGKGSFEYIWQVVNEWSSDIIEGRFVREALEQLQDQHLITTYISEGTAGAAPTPLFKLTWAGRTRLSAAPQQALSRVKGGLL